MRIVIFIKTKKKGVVQSTFLACLLSCLEFAKLVYTAIVAWGTACLPFHPVFLFLASYSTLMVGASPA